jgi:hypothetical protein
MELGIKGHKIRASEVIEILKMLGGNNRYIIIGGDDNSFYYIDDKYKTICNSYIGPDEIKGYEIFSLEEFLEKFPYKVGDKVNVWVNHEHFSGPRAELEVAEIKSMRWNSARCEVAYRMKELTGEFYKSEIKGKVTDDEEQQIDPSIDYYKVVENELYEDIEKRKIEITMDTLFRAGITLEHLKECGCELPDGYHFTDENGNVIDTTKIRLVKNTPYYPKSYDECCDVLSMEYATYYNLRYFTYEPGYYEYTTADKLCSLQDKLNIMGKLIICRNAYWKIAGEYLELNKPWEPDFSDDSPKYNIFKYENEITLSDNNWSNRILVFPTLEMRNAFYKNFKHLIEQCKELL